ncbi:MAG: hypothetical protein KDD62_09115, partial [Bdellovibrionales bacterium]|nr:hypothetical protein [Bdellovibrionales bacterium]
VVTSIYFMLRSPSFAIQEVVISLYPHQENRVQLFKFIVMSMGGMLVLCAVSAFTAFAEFWFVNITGIDPTLLPLTLPTFQLGIVIPSVGIGLYACQGILISQHRSKEVWK